ncbi:hypothetical protein [Bradyrhizobium sp. NP1]|uniref:hypothetical protein n=1 Tax=Bradyrhizobium sp. NP1 TaxID=3049772 RepID=UPI0025A633B6|nr:hypothetical protein [Bradyrhizobium sp. NP1]WJR78766.1 hypothetical protein QOU61_02855 [Bradyrhizobium sp. NP1]
MEDDGLKGVPELPKGGKGSGLTRMILNVASGAIPFAGGVLAAAASAWSERDQNRVNEFLHHMIAMLQAEMREKEQTILEITARIDMNDEKVSERIKSPAYQALLRKAFRDWAGTESEQKRIYIRNILSNAAGTTIASDDVVKLFLDWISDYSELHFLVIGAIFNSAGITRGGIWRKLGRQPVREDSSDADLFRLIIRDLSMGGITRQHRETDYSGQFLAKRKAPPSPKGTIKPMKSAFDDEEQYELTALGDQFIHYAMTDLPLKLEFNVDQSNDPN